MPNIEQTLIRTFENKLNDYYFSRLINIGRRRGWFGKNLTKEIAYFVGKVSGDGNLDPLFTVRLTGERRDLEDIKVKIVKEFDVEPHKIKLRLKHWNNGKGYILQISDACFGRMLYSFGAPQGNKTKVGFLVPQWILKSKKTVQRFYLQALLEDELSTIKIEKSNYSKTPYFKMSKSEKLLEYLVCYIGQVRQMVKEFGIECSSLSRPILENIKKNDTTFSVYFSIRRNKANIMKFDRCIGFRINRNKTRSLKECCSTLRSLVR